MFDLLKVNDKVCAYGKLYVTMKLKKNYRDITVLDQINSNDKSVKSKNYKDAMSEGQIIKIKKIMCDF